MAVTPQDIAARLRAEVRVRDERARARALGLRDKTGAAARLLRAAGACRVWLFGSLAGELVRTDSDVDLAAEGLPSASYFDVLAALLELFGTRVDLVRLEDAPRSLRERIAATGREL